MRRTSGRIAVIAILFVLGHGNARAATVTLFDGSLGTLPTAQGLTFRPGGFLCLGADGSEAVSFGGMNVDVQPEPMVGEAGRYGYPKFTTPLDRNTGVNLTFELQVHSENHASENRSGFAVIIITQDLQAIELGFWTEKIWAQNVGFTHGEETDYLTGASLTTYSLEILGSGYSLFAAGGNAPLLSGTLRDYSASGSLLFGFLDVYTLKNFLFLGDNTTSAQSNIALGDITLTTLAAPLPSSIGLLLAACVSLFVSGRRAHGPAIRGG